MDATWASRPEISSLSWADLALQQVLLAGARVQARFEQRIFRRQQNSDGILGRPIRQFGRNSRLIQTVTFGHQPRDPGAQFIELLAHHLEIGLGLGRVEPHQQIAGRHPHSVMDLDLRDNPAGGMLNGFDVGLNDEIARHRDGPRQRHEHEPAAGQQRHKEENPKPGSQLMLERAPRPRLQAIAGSFVLESRIATIDDEGNARDQTGAAPLDQLARARLRGAGRRQSRALEQHGLMYVIRPRDFRSGFGEVHHHGDVGRNDPVLAASRRPDRLGRCFADARIRCGRLQAELFEANVEGPPHLALLPPRRPAGLPTPTRSRRVARRAIRLRRTRLVPVLAFERVPQTLQFQDQGGALRSQFAAAGILDRASLVPVEMECVRFAPHGYTRSATAAR